MNQLEKAEMVARWAHRDQFDMEGMPYWTHCLRVAGNLNSTGYDEETLAIGWLHDVVEDCEVTFADLQELGFSNRIIEGVDAMTQRRPAENVEEYWQRLARNPDALNCKLYGDIPDNDDPLRRARAVATGRMSPTLANKLEKKYKRAREVLLT